MKLHAVAALSLAALALAACDNPKARHIPPDPMAAPPPAAAPAPRDGMSAGLAKRPEFPGFYLDRIGAAPDPVNKQPAATPGDAPITLDGFGFDPVAKVPAKGVDVVIDGKAYGATYGGSRPDVASYFKVPALAPNRLHHDPARRDVGQGPARPGGPGDRGGWEGLFRVAACPLHGELTGPGLPDIENVRPGSHINPCPDEPRRSRAARPESRLSKDSQDEPVATFR